jgi:hydrogenase-4 transcriptional activator
VIERAMILYRGEPLVFDDLQPASQRPARSALGELNEESLGMDAFAARHIRWALDATGGKISGPGGAAEQLEINPNTLRDRMRRLGISPKKDIGRPK